LAEAAFPSSAPSSAVGALQALMRADPAPDFATLVAAAGPEALKLAAARAGLPLRDDPASALLAAHHAAEDGDAERLRVEVPRKRPRLAWQGMHRTPAVVGVPAQVLEVVRPGLSTRQAGRQLEPGALSGKTVRGGGAPATNRLIWTNDNLIALASLLEERDEAGAYRYRGKVDLVYIDPPFMVNSNFVADNAISVDVDEEEGVAATKEELHQLFDQWDTDTSGKLDLAEVMTALRRAQLRRQNSIETIQKAMRERTSRQDVQSKPAAETSSGGGSSNSSSESAVASALASAPAGGQRR
jgi:adenine-specific DNA-methyltransferase